MTKSKKDGALTLLSFISRRNRSEWTSNQFIYDTENPAKVIFVYPTADDNGFYNGGWIISSKAPEFYKFTKPNMQNSMN